MKMDEEKMLYKCKKCGSTKLEGVYYSPHAIGFIQEEGKGLRINYHDFDEVQLTKCKNCGNTDSYGLICL